MTLNRAKTIIAYGGAKPSDISQARWNAIVAHVKRETCDT